MSPRPLLRDRLSAFVDFSALRTLTIHDEWHGMNPHAPLVASYDLQLRRGGAFRGKGFFSTSLAGEREISVTVSRELMILFCEALGRAPVVNRRYEPFCGWTDDFPRIEVTLHAAQWGRGGGTTVLYTESQGEFHAPWGIIHRGEFYRSRSPTIGKALALLSVALKRSTLREMQGVRT